MLNPQLDAAQLAAAYAVKRRLMIETALVPDAAETIWKCLAQHTPWSVVYNAGGATHVVAPEEMAAMPSAARGELIQGVMRRARGEFQFLYNAYLMLENYLARKHPGFLLDDVFEIINGPPMLDFVRQVTGISGLVKADAQATLYAPGHFLSAHNDFDAAKGRRVAYVMQFTKAWRPDWGGMLQFFDAAGNVVDGFLPRFNALMLFTVPQDHAVTYVPPFAPVGRFAITGWFMDR